MKPPVLSALATACLLAACAHAPPAPPAIPAPAAFSTTQEPGAALASRADWWQLFADPDLDDLVARAHQHHPRLAEATARVAQARAQASLAGANARPQIGANASATRQGGPLVNAAGGSGTLLTAGVGASTSLDLGGRLATAREAARLDVLAAEAQWRAAQLQVQAEVVQQLLALRALDAERALQREALAGWQATLRIVQARQRLGGVAESAVQRVELEVAQAEAEDQALAQRREASRVALAAAVGAAPGQVVIDERPASALPPPVPAGVPAAMLARRADVAATQARLQAALARQGAAQAAWMPELTLGASAGQASPDLANLLSASVRAWSVGAALALPLFDGGRRDAAREQAQADVDLALAQHRSAVFTACREVEEQLVALQGLARREAAQQRAVEAAGRQAQGVRQRQASGGASAADVVEAERAWLQARHLALQIDAAQRQALLALVQALGGGWDAGAADRLAGAPLQPAEGS